MIYNYVVTYLHQNGWRGGTVSIATFSSRQFNHDAGKAKKAAEAGPVFITDRGRPAYVLLTFDAYKKISRKRTKITDLLSMPGIGDIEFDIPQLGDLAQAADFS
jgi:hypothetical protein